MPQVQILPPAAKFLNELKDKKLKSLYKEAIEMICEDYSIGEEKTGDLARTREDFCEELKRYMRDYITVHICITR